jgi:hypothetical protein
MQGQGSVFEEHIKEVFSGVTVTPNIIEVTEVDELERTGTGTGMS